MTVQRTRRKYVKPENQCLYMRCTFEKLEASKADGWSSLGLCEIHTKAAKKILNRKRRIFYNA